MECRNQAQLSTRDCTSSGCAVTSGVACLGPDRGRTACLVRREDWIGEPPPFDRDRALAELARRLPRSLRRRRPTATSPTGRACRCGDVRAGLEAISTEIEQVRAGGGDDCWCRGRQPRPPAAGQVRMLGNFDTYLLGWKDRASRSPTSTQLHVKQGGGGWIRPVIVEDGVVVGGWRSPRKGGRLEITLNLPQGRARSPRRADRGRGRRHRPLRGHGRRGGRLSGAPRSAAPGYHPAPIPGRSHKRLKETDADDERREPPADHRPGRARGLGCARVRALPGGVRGRGGLQALAREDDHRGRGPPLLPADHEPPPAAHQRRLRVPVPAGQERGGRSATSTP